MRTRSLLVGFVTLSAVLAYIGVRYQAKRRPALLTIQLEKALDANEGARAVHLLQMGADANAKESDGTPLIFAALNFEGTSVLKAFIAAGADVNVEYSPVKGTVSTLLSQERQWTLTEDTAQQGEQMKCLLDAGANPNRGTLSVLANSAGGCGEGSCWCNPREIALLLHLGAKLRKGDAAAILEAALNDGNSFDGNNGPRLLLLWATLPIPSQERRTLLHKAIKRFSNHWTVDADEKYRIQTLAFLQHELRKTQSGSQHH